MIKNKHTKASVLKTLVVTTFVATTIFIFKDAFTSNNGIAGRTGSPGESTCWNGCHNSSALNSGPGTLNISSPNLTNWEYVPGSTYDIDVTVSQSGIGKFGFAMEALLSSGANAGTLVVTNSTTMQLKSAPVGGNNRTSITHKTGGGVASNSKTFSFQWTAPATFSGNVTFYAAGNATNSSNTSAGDFIYTTSQVVTPSTAGISEPVFSEAHWMVNPNPVKDHLVINYKLEKASDVTIELYDLSGRFQIPLFVGAMGGGQQIQHFDIEANLAEGVYFVKLQAGYTVSYKKIMIAR